MSAQSSPDAAGRQIQAAQVPDSPAAAAALLEASLARIAGVPVAPVSLTLDYGAPLTAGETVSVEAWVERATRTLVFAHGRVLRADGALAAAGAGVFRRLDVAARD